MKTTSATLTFLALALMVAAPALAAGAGPFEPITPIRQELDKMWTIVFWPAMIVFVLVEAAILYIIFKFRGNRTVPPPEKHRGNNTVEVVWTAVPALTLVIIGILSANAVTFIDSYPTGDDVDTIQVEGRQWLWTFTYPDGNQSTNVLYLEEGRKYHFEVVAPDVIHDFNVPELGIRIDAVPTRTNHAWTEVSKPGTYTVYCTEFCGLAHGYMTAKVVVAPEGTYPEGKRYGVPPAASS